MAERPLAARPRVGVIVPASNGVLEEDLRQHLGDGALVLGARVRGGRELGEELLAAMAVDARAEVAKLVAAQPAVVAYGCTSGSFFGGPGYERELAGALQEAAGAIPLVTAAGALVEELSTVGARRVGFASPYPEDIHARGVAHIGAQGFDIAANACLGVGDNHAIAQVDDATLRALVTAVATHADAVVLSCTGLPTAGRVRQLRELAGVPVITSNGAIAAAAWRRCPR